MNKKQSVVYLDEIDVIQMAYSAMEMYPKETFGLFLGRKEVKEVRALYYVHFVQILASGQRTKDAVYYGDRALERLKEIYNFNIIGDWHSHPKASAKPAEPSREDIIHVQKTRGCEAIIVILGIGRDRSQAEEPKFRKNVFIIRDRNSITCYFNEFEIGIHFFRIKAGISKIRMNQKLNFQLEKVRVVCRPRTKIHQAGKKPLKII